MDQSFHKIILVGDSGVGKSCILNRYTDKVFIENQPTTIGVDFKLTKILIDGNIAKLSIFDTAGQERFKTLIASYYRGAHGIVFVYDITSRESFENIIHWMKEAEMYSSFEESVKMVIGNKIDKEADSPDEPRVVTREEGLNFAYKNKMLFLETSAKTNEGIDDAFEELTRKIMQVDTFAAGDAEDGQRVSLGGTQEEEQGGYCC